MMRIHNRRVGVVLLCLVCSFCYFFYMNVHIGRIRLKWPSVLTKKVYQRSWKEIFCSHLSQWNTSSPWPPVKTVSEQLRVKNGDSVFLNGLGCSEWPLVLHKFFPKVKLFGVDSDEESVKYAKQTVNGSFETAKPNKLTKLNFAESTNFDHGITEGVLAVYDKEIQCSVVKQMLPLLKPGGSLYIGQNFEDCHETGNYFSNELNKQGIQILPKCFWTDHCLRDRPDVAVVLYARETDLYGTKTSKIEWKECSTAVFIYKNIFVSKDKVKDPHPAHSKLEESWYQHKCSRSVLLMSNQTESHIKVKYDKNSIKNAVKAMKEKGLDMHR